jgi:hypothetical protein
MSILFIGFQGFRISAAENIKITYGAVDLAKFSSLGQGSSSD